MKKIKITIGLEFGSEWQVETWNNMFIVLFETMKSHFESKHKKNLMTIEYEKESKSKN